MSTKNKQSKEEEISWFIDCLLHYLQSPFFRVQIKDFVDDNCIIFDGGEESTFEQTKIHNNFKELIETLLEQLLKDLGVSVEQFLLASKIGLETENKKYFEQLMVFDNFMYFKQMMAKRNFQISQEAYVRMAEESKNVIKAPEVKVSNPINNNQVNKPTVSQSNSRVQIDNKPVQQPVQPQSVSIDLNKDKDYQELLKKKEQAEIDCAIQLSIALEKEKKKLIELEDTELIKALDMSKDDIQRKLKESNDKDTIKSLNLEKSQLENKLEQEQLLRAIEMSKGGNNININNSKNHGLSDADIQNNKNIFSNLNFDNETPKTSNINTSQILQSVPLNKSEMEIPKPQVQSQIQINKPQVQLQPPVQPQVQQPLKTKMSLINQKDIEAKSKISNIINNDDNDDEIIVTDHSVKKPILKPVVKINNDSNNNNSNIKGGIISGNENVTFDKPQISVQPQSKPQVSVQPQSKPQISVQPQSKPQISVQPQTKPEVTLQPQSKPQISVQPESKPKISAQPQTKPEVTVQPQEKPKVSVQPHTNPEVQAQPAVILPSSTIVNKIEPQKQPLPSANTISSNEMLSNKNEFKNIKVAVTNQPKEIIESELPKRPTVESNVVTISKQPQPIKESNFVNNNKQQQPKADPFSMFLNNDNTNNDNTNNEKIDFNKSLSGFPSNNTNKEPQEVKTPSLPTPVIVNNYKNDNNEQLNFEDIDDIDTNNTNNKQNNYFVNNINSNNNNNSNYTDLTTNKVDFSQEAKKVLGPLSSMKTGKLFTMVNKNDENKESIVQSKKIKQNDNSDKNDLDNMYEQLQKEKEEKMKEYKDQILREKKEKRIRSQIEKGKQNDAKPSANINDVNTDTMTPDEKAKYEKRKLLANQLKKK